MRWVENAIALVAWLSAPLVVAWASVDRYTSTTCINGHCSSFTHSDAQDHPVKIAIILIGILVFGLIPAGIIYAHSRALTGSLLLTIWLLVPVLALLVVGLSFTWMGIVAFFWGSSLLLAGIVGGARQLAGRWLRVVRTEHRADARG
jgi:hypothetical protein